jgi:hypothetical protein
MTAIRFPRRTPKSGNVCRSFPARINAVKLRENPFVLSLSKGEWIFPNHLTVKPFMVRQAHHERLNLTAFPLGWGWIAAPPRAGYQTY